MTDIYDWEQWCERCDSNETLELGRTRDGQERLLCKSCWAVLAGPVTVWLVTDREAGR